MLPLSSERGTCHRKRCFTNARHPAATARPIGLPNFAQGGMLPTSCVYYGQAATLLHERNVVLTTTAEAMFRLCGPLLAAEIPASASPGPPFVSVYDR